VVRLCIPAGRGQVKVTQPPRRQARAIAPRAQPRNRASAARDKRCEIVGRRYRWAF